MSIGESHDEHNMDAPDGHLCGVVDATEVSRVAALRGCGLLDTAREPAFDALVRLAAKACDTPIAAISLVDQERQWFKAITGLLCEQTPRDQAFCSHAIMQQRPLVVEDTTRDERFKSNTLVTGPPGIRFYAGVPLRLTDGHAVGTLCVIDTRARTLTNDQLAELEALALQAQAQIELARRVVVEREMRAALRFKEAQLAALFDHAPVGMFLADPTGHCYYFNDAWQAMAGIGQQQAQHGGWTARLAGKERERILQGWTEAVMDRRAYQCQTQFVHPDGSCVDIEGHAFPYFDQGTCVGYIGMTIDISRRLRAQEHADRLNSSLADINARLEARNSELMQLTFALTHDLQTPLATVGGQLSLAEHAAGPQHTATGHVRKAKASVKRMAGMLDDLMAYAKAGSERLRLTVVDARACIEDVVRELTPLAELQGVRLEVSSHVPAGSEALVRVDAGAFVRCVQNLVGNAIKFTSSVEGERLVAVSIMCEDEAVRVVVADSGPGMPEMMLSAVFLPFKRAHRQLPGTGLGLATVKRFVEAFGGRVWLEKNTPRGIRAVLELGHASRGSEVEASEDQREAA